MASMYDSEEAWINTPTSDFFLMKEALNIARIGLWQLEMDPAKVHWSQEVYMIHEVPQGTEISLEQGIDFYEGEYKAIISAAVQKAIDEQTGWDEFCQIRTAKGNVIWVRTIGRVMVEEGKVVRLHGLFQNVNEEKLRSEAVKESEIRFKSIFHQTYAFLGLIDSKGIILEANEAALQFRGEQWALGQDENIFTLPWWQNDANAQQKLRAGLEAAQRGGPVETEIELTVEGGKSVFLNCSLTPVLQTEGAPDQLLLEIRDRTSEVTLQQAVVQHLRYYVDFVSNAPVAVAMFDNEMRYLAASRQFISDYGLAKKHIMGVCHYDVFPEIRSMQHWLDSHQLVLGGEKYSIEKDKFVRADGTVQWLKYTLIPWYKTAREIGGILMFTADITDQIVYTEKLANLNAELEQKVNQRTADLQRLNEELKQFIHIATHDLQEPLRTISSYIEVLQEEDATDQDFLFERISKASVRMQRLVNDLLEYSRAGTQPVEDAVDLGHILAELKESLYGLMVSKKGTIEIGDLPTLKGAQMDFRQLLQNLIENALKYSRADLPPVVQVYAAGEGPETIFFVVDNGIGIDPAYATRIFQIFQRLHTEHSYAGTGMGLSIAKKIVERYEGHIWVEPSAEAGSKFCFTLPLAF